MANWLMAFALFGPVGPLNSEAPGSFALVKKLDSATLREKWVIQRELAVRPGALWAVTWGSLHDNPEIVPRCEQILSSWTPNTRLPKLISSARGDFDHLLNSLLSSSAPDLDLLAAASEAGRALDKYYVDRIFPSLSVHPLNQATPFHEFSLYAKERRPTLFSGSFELSRGGRKPYLAKCDSVKSDEVISSIVLCEGNVELMYGCAQTLLIAGGDVTIGHPNISMVIAGGDIRLRSGSGASGSMIVAGGKITLKSGGYACLFISPQKLQFPIDGRIDFPTLVFDSAQKPAPGFFTFRDLWADYGLEAALEQGRVKITKAKADGPFSHLLKQDDIIVAFVHPVAPHPQPFSPEGRGEKKKLKIDSVGQFRRLLGHSLDLGSFDFDIERAGKAIALHEKHKKK